MDLFIVFTFKLLSGRCRCFAPFHLNKFGFIGLERLRSDLVNDCRNNESTVAWGKMVSHVLENKFFSSKVFKTLREFLTPPPFITSRVRAAASCLISLTISLSNTTKWHYHSHHQRKIQLYNSCDVGISTTVATERTPKLVEPLAAAIARDERPLILLQDFNNPSLANEVSFMCLHQSSSLTI